MANSRDRDWQRPGEEALDTLIGAYIGNYRVLKKIGQGAMGKVLLAEHPRIGRRVAIKLLSRLLSHDPDIAGRFTVEARTVNTIRHPNIIEIFDLDTLPDGRLYYVMEHLEGEELRELILREAPLPPPLIATLLDQITAALQCAHDQGVVHRDLKPENIFLVPHPEGLQVKLLDFGIAKILADSTLSELRTSTGMIMGTPYYMSPEQASGRVKDISAASDIYALGIMLYEMLTARGPFRAATTAEILAAHIATPPAPLDSVRPGLPDAVRFCVDQCLAKDPRERPARARVVYEIFRQGMDRIGPAPAHTHDSEAIAETHISAAPTVAPGVADRARAAAAGAAAWSPAPVATPSPTPWTDSPPPAAAPPVALTPAPTPATPLDQPPPPGSSSTVAPIARPRSHWVFIALLGAAVLGTAVLMGRWMGGTNQRSDGATPPASSPPASTGSAPGEASSARDGAAPKATIHLSAKPDGTRADLRVGATPATRIALPYRFSAPHGTRVTVRFLRTGHEEQVESWIVQGPRAFAVTLEPLAPGAAPPRPRPRPRHAGIGTGPGAAASRRQPPGAVTPRPRDRPTPPRPDPRPRPREVQEGTLRPPGW